MIKEKNKTTQLFEMPKVKKQLFLKTFVILSFFFGSNFAYNKLTYKAPLPYKDDQELPHQNQQHSNLLEQLEIQLALEAYEHLLSQLHNKASKLGVNLSQDYTIKIISYDNMTDSIEVVLQNKNKTTTFEFSATNLSYLKINQNITLSDQISQLAMLLNAPILKIPVVNSFNSSLNNTLDNFATSGVVYYSNSSPQFSSGNDRTHLMDNLLLTGRDYMYFNVYGKGLKNGVEYDVVSIISMTKDDYDILDQPNLLNYFLNNPTDSRFTINVFYQESLQVLEKLNNAKFKEQQLENQH